MEWEISKSCHKRDKIYNNHKKDKKSQLQKVKLSYFCYFAGRSEQSASRSVPLPKGGSHRTGHRNWTHLQAILQFKLQQNDDMRPKPKSQLRAEGLLPDVWKVANAGKPSE